MAGFSDQLSAFALKAENAVDQVMREVVYDVGRTVWNLSPVDTTRFRSNWYYAPLSPGFQYNPDARNKPEVNNLEDVPKKASRVDHYITNRTPYGPYLERGSSQQAPQGMIVLTQLSFPNIVANAARKAGISVEAVR